MKKDQPVVETTEKKAGPEVRFMSLPHKTFIEVDAALTAEQKNAIAALLA